MIHAASRARRPRPPIPPPPGCVRNPGVVSVRSGLPKQTVEQWEGTLCEAIATGAAHISVYDLQVTLSPARNNGFSYPWSQGVVGTLL